MQELQEMWIQTLGCEDPLEEAMATLSNILAWIIPLTEELGGLPSVGLQRVRRNWSDFARMCVMIDFSVLFQLKPFLKDILFLIK